MKVGDGAGGCAAQQGLELGKGLFDGFVMVPLNDGFLLKFSRMA
jgi:hypothetical protein